MKTYYDILHVTENADISVIDATYWVQMEKYNSGIIEEFDENEVDLNEVRRAYECLIDPERRRTYDAKLKKRSSSVDSTPPVTAPKVNAPITTAQIAPTPTFSSIPTATPVSNEVIPVMQSVALPVAPPITEVNE